MPGFSVTPVGPFPPVNPEDFPDFLQWQWEGVDVGGTTVDTVNLTGSGVASVTVGTGENTNTLTVEIEGGGASEVSWRDVPGDTTLAITDAGNALSTSGTTGAQNVTVPLDTGDADVDLPIGASVLVYQEGAADVNILAAGGVTLNVRYGFTATIAGQDGIVTLLKRSANNWILCGDMGVI